MTNDLTLSSIVRFGSHPSTSFAFVIFAIFLASSPSRGADFPILNVTPVISLTLLTISRTEFPVSGPKIDDIICTSRKKVFKPFQVRFV